MVDFYENMMLNVLEHGKRSTDTADDAADNWEGAVSPRSASPENDVDDILESFSAERYAADVTLSRLFSLESEKYALEVISGAAYLNRFVLPLSGVKYESLLQRGLRSENNLSNARKLCVVETFLEDPATYKSRASQINKSRDAPVKISRDSAVHLSRDQRVHMSPDRQLRKSHGDHPSALRIIGSAVNPRLLNVGIGTCISPSATSSEPPWSPAATDISSCVRNVSISKCNLDLIELFCNDRDYSHDFRHISQLPLSDIIKCDSAAENKNDSNSSVMINIYSPDVGLHQELINNNSAEDVAHTNLNNIYSLGCEAGNVGINNKIIDIRKKEFNKSSDSGAIRHIVTGAMTINDVSVTSDFVTDSNTNLIKSSTGSQCEQLLIPATLNDNNSLNGSSRTFDSICTSNLLSDDQSSAVKITKERCEGNSHDVRNIPSVNLDFVANDFHHSKGLKSIGNVRHSDEFVASYPVTSPLNRRSMLEDIDSYKSFKFGMRSNPNDVATRVGMLKSTRLFGSVDSLRSSTGSSQCSNFLDDHSIEEILECALEDMSDLSDGDQSSFSTLSQKRFHKISQGANPVALANSKYEVVDDSIKQMARNLKSVVTAESTATYSVSQAVTLESDVSTVQTSSGLHLNFGYLANSTSYVSNAPPCVSNYLPYTSKVQYSASKVSLFNSKEPSICASSFRCLPVAIVSPSIISPLCQRSFTNLDPSIASGTPAPQHDATSNLTISVSNCLSYTSLGLPQVNSQSGFGYFPNVTQVRSDCASRSSSCEATIGDDEEGPRLSGVESSSDTFPNESYDDSTFEYENTSRMNGRTSSSSFKQSELIQHVALQKTSRITCVHSCSSSLTDTLSDDAASQANELTLPEQERSTNYLVLTSDEDQEVRNFCDIERPLSAENYDNDVDSLSTVTSEPESDVLTGSDDDPGDIKLNRYVICVPSFQITSQSINKCADYTNSEQVKGASVDTSTRLVDRNRLSKLYIYEYVEDEDATCSDVIDQPKEPTDVRGCLLTSCNNLNTIANGVHTYAQCTELQEDLPSGKNLAAVSDSRKNNFKATKRSRRYENSSREANLQSDTFLTRLAKYQIVPTVPSDKAEEVTCADSVLSLANSDGNDSIDIAFRDADICVQTCDNDSIKQKDNMDIASYGSDMCTLLSGIITDSMDSVLPTEVVVFNFSNESVDGHTLAETQTFKLLTPEEKLQISSK